MRHGPCGGVGPDGGCEVPGVVCPFVAADRVPDWAGPACGPRALALPPLVIDVRCDPADRRSVDAAAELLTATGAAGLLGEHLDDPVPGSRAAAAALVECGVPVVATVTGRGRTAEECEAEIGALVEVGVAAVHCVTGDHPAARFGPEATARFSLDSLDLAARARAAGAVVSVASSPASPPTGRRPARLRSKQEAGADLAIVNHGGPADHLVAFADRCRGVGATLPLVAPVPVVTDHRSARSLTQFPGVTLPPGLAPAILEADDPRTVGVEMAVEFGAALVTSGRYRHLNLSGAASAEDRHRVMEEVAVGLRGVLAS